MVSLSQLCCLQQLRWWLVVSSGQLQANLILVAEFCAEAPECSQEPAPALLQSHHLCHTGGMGALGCWPRGGGGQVDSGSPVPCQQDLQWTGWFGKHAANLTLAAVSCAKAAECEQKPRPAASLHRPCLHEAGCCAGCLVQQRSEGIL
jgi:hypothetical protein